MATFSIFRTTNAQWAWHLQADNSKIVIQSETYQDITGATWGVESVKANAPHASRYERRVSTQGKRYFVLTAQNGKVIAVSEEYSASAACEDAISWVKINAPVARTVVQR